MILLAMQVNHKYASVLWLDLYPNWRQRVLLLPTSIHESSDIIEHQLISNIACAASFLAYNFHIDHIRPSEQGNTIVFTVPYTLEAAAFYRNYINGDVLILPECLTICIQKVISALSQYPDATGNTIDGYFIPQKPTKKPEASQEKPKSIESKK